MLRKIIAALAAVLFLASAIFAQQVRFTNLSSEAQFGWASVTVPHSSEPSAFMLFGEKGTPAVRGREIGTHGWEVFVWLDDLKGESSVTGVLTPRRDSDAIAGAPFGFVLSPWVEAKRLRPRIQWRIGEETHGVDAEVIGFVDSNAARQVWHLRTAPWRGLVWEGWAYIHAASERVDWEWTLTWSDRESSAYTVENVACVLHWDHEVQIDFAETIGVRDQRWLSNGKWMSNLLWQTRLGDGEQYKYRASMFCSEPVGASEDFDPWRAFRIANLEAARGGPIRGVCLDWDTRWLAFGMTPMEPRKFKSADATHAAFLASMDTGGGMFDERPLASRKRTGATGGQKDFGAAQGGYAVTLGDPRRIWEMEYSDHGYFRGFHHREEDGRPLTHAAHQNWQTWSQYSDHRLGGDMLGKTNRPYSMRAGVSGFTGWDDQHRSQNFELALYALRPSFMLERAFLDGLESDLAQMNPKRPGAPRAQGRLMMVWANWALLLDAEARAKSRFVMDRRLGNALRTWDGKGLSDVKIRVIDGHVKDDRVLKDVDAWMPWQESIACMGYYAAWRTTHDPQYRDLALALAQSVTRGAFFKDATGWHVCTGVPWNNGEPLDPSFYYVGNPGLLISDGFHAWTGPACAVLLALDTTDGPDTVKARAILEHFYGNGYNNWADSSWMAIR